MFKVLAFACLITLAYTHTCLVYPAQRGGLGAGLGELASDICGKIESPCGGATPSTGPVDTFYSGRVYSIAFQKNLDHYNGANPGFFEIRIGDGNEFYKSLAVVPDSQNIRNLQILTVNVTMPEEGNTLQLIYQTNNPNAPPAFYQCADIKIGR